MLQEADTVERRAAHGFGLAQTSAQIGPYLLVSVLTFAILTLVLRLWDADFAVPFCDRGDSLCAQAWIKSAQDHGWFLHNPDLGAPWGADLYDYPLADDVHFLVIRGLSLVIRSPAVLFNVYFLLQFPLVACTGLFVMRRLGVAGGLALVASILYAFLPFHFLRGLNHFLLASYYLVPLQVHLIIRLGQYGQCIQSSPSRQAVLGWVLRLLLCFLVAGAGIYYAFFGCLFFLLAGLYSLYQSRSWRGVCAAALLSIATLSFVALHLAPQIAYLRANGKSPEAIVRSPSDAELLGLKIAHLLLPIEGHRSAYLAQWKARYLANGYLNNENLDASLGLIGSAAFLFLLVRLLRPRNVDAGPHLRAVDTLAIMNLAAVLVGTVGGFGILFSLFISSWIRAYNRISVFIAFFGFLGAALALTPFCRRLMRHSVGKWLLRFGLAAALTLGIWDQTSPTMIPDYAGLAAQHDSDVAFVRDIEAELPAGGMVLQLPYVAFPEAQAFGRCEGYDHLKPYLVSQGLRWSFGAYRGRPADSYVHMLSSIPPADMVRAIVVVGFEGIVIDRFAYQDEASEIEHNFSAVLNQTPRTSRDGRWTFFSLGELRAKLKSMIGEGHWQQAKRDLSKPILPVFGAGFAQEEGPPDAAFRWCKSHAELWLGNSEGFSRTVELEFNADRLATEPVHLEVVWPTGKKVFLFGYGKQRFHIRLEVLPGAMPVQFYCDGTPVSSSTPSREMVFRFANLTVLPESVP